MSCNNSSANKKNPQFPAWLKRPIAFSGKQKNIHENIHAFGLHTVCVEAKCPNRSECYSKGTATFLILGDTCTRFCSFCSVNHGIPESLDTAEPLKILNAVKTLNLKHVVITSVTRDDLLDGGASIYIETIARLKQSIPHVTVEVLVPDFKGERTVITSVIEAKPDIFNHNIETVPRLYSKIRPQAEYRRSLEVLSIAAENGLTAKSGIMVGLGESPDEVMQVMRDLHSTGCKILTIGQYLQPSKRQTEVKEFISPDQFKAYEKYGYKLGFLSVFAGPFVRSSYMAEKIFEDVPH